MSADQRFTAVMFGLGICVTLVGVMFRFLIKLNNMMVTQNLINQSLVRHDKNNSDQIVELLKSLTTLHLDMEKRVSTLEGEKQSGHR